MEYGTHSLIDRRAPLFACALLLTALGCTDSHEVRVGGAIAICETNCESDEFCRVDPHSECGDIDPTGTCTERPTICTRHYDPVCGCDGETYGNDCEAAAAGISIVRRGACDEAPTACGAELGLTCGDDEYCHFEPGTQCDYADATGECRPRPQVCTDHIETVCGCDQRTYGNPCEAAAAGTAVASFGACSGDGGGEGADCGGLLGLTCADGLACIYDPESSCGNGDQMGTCRVMHLSCTLEYDPVCGCDGETYGNACAATSVGVSILHAGECGVGCGGWLGDTCATDEYCYFEPNTQCDYADASGICRTRPDACTEQYDPVCGCNGQTYSNACFAAAAGTSVATLGECGG